MSKENKKQYKYFYLLSSIFYLFALDRFFKFLAINHFFNNPIKVLGSFFHLSFQPNYNIAFSIPIGGMWLNIVIFIIIIGFITHLVAVFRKSDYLYIGCLSFIILGATSNLFDRLKYGFVIDYFDLKYFSVFNLADAMICLGVFGLLISTTRLK